MVCLSSWYISIKMHFIPLLPLQWWSQPLKILPIPVKATFSLIPSLTLFCPFPRSRQLCDLSLWLNGHMCYGCYHIHAFCYRYLCTYNRSQDFVFENPPEIILPNDCFESPRVQRRFRGGQSRTAEGSWERLSGRVCVLKHTHTPSKQSVLFLSASHIGVNV